ncbi:MAG: chalcone isomerase family protein [Chromatocurvus sp.]
MHGMTGCTRKLKAQCLRALTIVAVTLLPLALQAAEAELEKVGEARLKVLLWSVYDSRLYAPGGQYERGKRPLKLEIEYLRDIRAEDLVKRTGEEWDELGVAHERQGEWMQQLLSLWPDVSKNDVLTLELDAANHATFYNNGRRLGTIEDPAFGQNFIDIWLSPQTSRPDMRLALIGGREST